MIAALSWLKAPNFILAAVVVLGGLGVWIVNSTQKQAAYNKGVEAGKGAASTVAVISATETAEAERRAEAETPLPANKQEVIERCKRSASCRERGTLK